MKNCFGIQNTQQSALKLVLSGTIVAELKWTFHGLLKIARVNFFCGLGGGKELNGLFTNCLLKLFASGGQVLPKQKAEFWFVLE